MAGIFTNRSQGNTLLPPQEEDPVNEQIRQVEAASGTPGHMQRAISTSITGLGVKMMGSGLADLFDDKEISKAVAKDFDERIAPAIYQRWYQQDALAFNTLVAQPYSQAGQTALRQYQTKMSQLENGLVMNADGSTQQIDPLSPEAVRFREQATREMMQTTLGLDTQVIQASTHPKWADNPFIQQGVSNLMKFRIDSQNSFLEAHESAMKETEGVANIQRSQAETMKAQQDMQQDAAKHAEWQKYAPEREESNNLSQDLTRAQIRNLDEQPVGRGASNANLKGIPDGVAPEELPSWLLTTPEGNKRISRYMKRAEAAFTAEQAKKGVTANDPKLAGEWAKRESQASLAAVGEYILDLQGGGKSAARVAIAEHPEWAEYIEATGVLTAGDDKPTNQGITRRMTVPEIESVSDTATGDVVQRVVDQARELQETMPMEKFLNDGTLDRTVEQWMDENVADNPSTKSQREILKGKILRKVRMEASKGEGPLYELITGEDSPGIFEKAARAGEAISAGGAIRYPGSK